MIYFYNTFHNGDIHYSRTFIRDIMYKLGNNDYCYLHNNKPDILKDIVNLKHDKSFDSFEGWQLISKYPISYFDQVIQTDNDLYINTWVGQQGWITKNGTNRNRNRNDRYCSLYSHYELYQDIFDTLSIPINSIEYYIPEIDFNFINKDNIDRFISGSKYDLKILIVNNEPLTVRIYMDMLSVVDYLSTKYIDVQFILTMKTDLNKDNITYTNDIINIDSDLNEIGYLAKYCDIIVGRPSGPYCYCMNKDTFIKDKTFITISNNTYDRFYFESESDMLLLTDHTTSGLSNIIENKLITYYDR